MGTNAARMLKDDDLGPADEALLDLLNEGRVTAPFAAEEADYSLQYVRDRLNRLVEHGNAEKVYEGLYELVEDPREGGGEDKTTETVEDPEPEREPEPNPAPTAPDTSSFELPSEIGADVWDVVDEVSASWDDDEDRLRNRRQAAATVLQHAVDTGEGIGKSHDIVDRVREEYPVSGQNPETFWRKNIRDVLKAVGEYSRGTHAYTVNDLGGDDV